MPLKPAGDLVTADYPFTVLASASPAAKELHRRLAEHLRTPDVQRQIMAGAHYRPAVPGVPLDRPLRTFYVLDTSGSMADQDRIGALRGALAGLAGADDSLVGRFRRFRGREEVTLLPFSTTPAAPLTYTVAEDDPAPTLQRITAAGNALVPDGDTAIYGSLEAAYRVAEQQIAADPDRFTSIVLMTDGENTVGPDLLAFRDFVRDRPASVRGVPVFPVLFGESDNAEMNEVAALTGGRTFDARTGSLSAAFTEIRGYV